CKGKADYVFEYGPKDLDNEFVKKNKHILSQDRGGGYWLWKPYIILNALNKLDEGDYLFYCDSGAYFINNLKYLISELEKTDQEVMCFEASSIEKMYSKKDAFILMQAKPEHYLSNQILGGFILLKNTSFSRKLVTEWLKYAQDYRIITDSPNELGYTNSEIFKEHRHDQTIWSLLTKKYNIKPYINPSLNQIVANRKDFVNKKSTTGGKTRKYMHYNYRQILVSCKKANPYIYKLKYHFLPIIQKIKKLFYLLKYEKM
ncbi:MAG: hypothetical protein ATN32_09960, partial [Candidatus Epulonipiscium fishelsonii]